MGARDWFVQASATFAGGAVAIGLIAVPTYVWLPREFDQIHQQIGEVRAFSKSSSDMAAETIALSTETIESQRLLTQEIASWRAQPIGSLDIFLAQAGHIVPSGPMYGWGSAGGIADLPYMSADTFLGMLPADVGESLSERSLVGKFAYTEFAGAKWIFVGGSDYNSLTTEMQEAIEERLVTGGFHFSVKLEF